MDHVTRRQRDLHGLVDGQDHDGGADERFAAHEDAFRRVEEGPFPLEPLHVDLHLRRLLLLDLHERPFAEREERRNDDGGDHEEHAERTRSSDRLRRGRVVALAVPDDAPDEQPLDTDEDGQREAHDDEVQRVHVVRLRRDPVLRAAG